MYKCNLYTFIIRIFNCRKATYLSLNHCYEHIGCRFSFKWIDITRNLKRYNIPGCFRVTASAISELYVVLGEGAPKTEGKSSQPCLAKSLTNVPI